MKDPKSIYFNRFKAIGGLALWRMESPKGCEGQDILFWGEKNGKDNCRDKRKD